MSGKHLDMYIILALDRAQELCILLETYWERMNLKCPIYFRSETYRVLKFILLSQCWYDGES